MKRFLKTTISSIVLVAFVALYSYSFATYKRLSDAEKKQLKRDVSSFFSVKNHDGGLVHIESRNCEGVLKHHLGFGYYQVDKLWCQVANGYARAESATIVHKSDIYSLWEKDICISGDACYSPINEESVNRYIRKDGRWVSK